MARKGHSRQCERQGRYRVRRFNQQAIGGLYMELLGTVEPLDGATAERNAWVALISAHSSLAPVTPRQGINPFTRKPHSFEARADSARILLDEIDVGAVRWAE